MGFHCYSVCERWSVCVSALIYLSFLGLVWTLALPLRPLNPIHGISEGNGISETLVGRPPDHLEGVRIERDGDINKNFRKEIFIGEGEFERRKEEDPKELLEDIFVRYFKIRKDLKFSLAFLILFILCCFLQGGHQQRQFPCPFRTVTLD